MQLIAVLFADVYPLGHAAQARSLVAVPSTDTYVPAAHTLHGVQLIAVLAVAEYVPFGHEEQTRGLPSEQGVDTNWPAPHDIVHKASPATVHV